MSDDPVYHFQKRRLTIYETENWWLVGLTFPSFWRPNQVPVRVGDRVETGFHLLQLWTPSSRKRVNAGAASAASGAGPRSLTLEREVGQEQLGLVRGDAKGGGYAAERGPMDVTTVGGDRVGERLGGRGPGRRRDRARKRPASRSTSAVRSCCLLSKQR